MEIVKKKNWKIEKLSFGCHFGRKRRGKESREISVKFENLEKKKWVNGLGFFAPIFSRWTGLKFVEIYEKKNEKLKKLSFGCHFGRKRRGKAGEISVKFENLEKKNEQMD